MKEGRLPSETPVNLLVLLKKEFARCRELNRSYSLRSFARKLEISHSALSQIMRGSRPLTLKTFQKLVRSLKLTDSEQEQLSKPLNLRQRKGKDAPVAPQVELEQMTADQFALVSDWYHFAIMELTRVSGFSENPTWIAKKLSISIKEAREAVARLVRLNMLLKTRSGRLKIQSNTNILSHNLTTLAKRHFQKQVLTKAINALDSIAVESRNQTSMTFACNSKMLPVLIEDLSKFRREFVFKAESYGKCDHVYHLGISLYPVTSIQSDSEKEKSDVSKESL